MLVIPVLDVQRGVVVRGIGGRRHEYQPIDSQLCPSADPLSVARALQSRFGLSTFYLADLDAIAGAGPNLELFAQLMREGFHLWIDAGIRNSADLEAFQDHPPSRLMVGSETIESAIALSEIVRAMGPERTIFSLDLVGGVPRVRAPEWLNADPLAIVTDAVARGVVSMLLLDLKQVGEGKGLGTEGLLLKAKERHGEVQFIVGGGIRGAADLALADSLGASAVLVASALHDGGLTRKDLAAYR